MLNLIVFGLTAFVQGSLDVTDVSLIEQQILNYIHTHIYGALDFYEIKLNKSTEEVSILT